jgi:hypothetical protein
MDKIRQLLFGIKIAEEQTMQKPAQASILIQEIVEAQAVSGLFRKIGVVPSYFDNLQEFWFGVMNEAPMISIVDVRLMSHGNMVLKEHPSLLNDELPIAFYYTNETKPLVFSTHDFFHFGLINGDEPLEGQLKAVLKRINKFDFFSKQTSMVRKEVDRLERSHLKLLSDHSVLKETQSYHDQLKDLMGTFESLVLTIDFNSAVAMFFEQWDAVEGFCLLELDSLGQKLVTPVTKTAKLKNVTELFLGQKCLGGIKLVAQKMADQVAYDLLGFDLVDLKLSGQYTLPETLIYIKVKPEIKKSFDWTLVNKLLNGFFAKHKLQTIVSYGEENSLISNWEFMSLLGQQISRQKYSQVGVVNINFKNLLKAITEEHNYDFEFKPFFEEFVNKTSNRSKTSFKLVNFNLENIAFIVDGNESSSFMNFMRDFVTRFDYAKFFHHPQDLDLEKIIPEVQMVPVSPYSYQAFSQPEKTSLIDVKKAERKIHKTITMHET